MPEISPSKYTVTASWSDAPHLDDKTKAELLAATAPHLRKARSMGTPSLGAGAIYPVEEDDVICDDFRLPNHFPRGYTLDVGWRRTAAMWLALDPDNDILYAYGEYYRGQAEPAIHAAAIKARGAWMTGAIDPAARGRQQTDGAQMLKLYQLGGLNLVMANNSVEAGLYEVWTRLSTGRFKIFKSLQNTLAEYRIYRRDDKGKVVKTNDHLMDCMRYGVNTPKILKPLPTGRTAVLIDPFARALDPAFGY